MTMSLFSVLGYELADLTVHPPPQQSRVGSFFSRTCLVLPNFFPPKKVNFVRELERTKMWFYVINTKTRFQQG